jgi:hypothetical protein
MLRKTTLIMVVVMVSVGATASVVAQDDGGVVDRRGQDALNQTERPDSVLRTVNEDVYLVSSRWDDGDAVVRVASRRDGAKVEVVDGVANWLGSSPYRETFTLREGVTEIRVPSPKTIQPEDSDEIYAVVLNEVGGDGKAAASGTVGYSWNIPAPPVGPASVFGVLVTGVSAFGVVVGLLRRYANVSRVYDIKPDRSFLRWLFGGGRR